MNTVEDTDDWRSRFKFLGSFLGLMALFAAVIKLGALTLVLSSDLKKSECVAAYWKARSQGQPSMYCPPGCECDHRLLR
jgi:hypothetical protein